MADIEKAINGWEHCKYKKNCGGCPYRIGLLTAKCIDDLNADVFELLKEHRDKNIVNGIPLKYWNGHVQKENQRRSD